MRIVLPYQSESRCNIFVKDFAFVDEFIKKVEKQSQSVFYIVDKRLLNFPQYSHFFKGKDCFFVEADESNKTLETVKDIYHFLLEKRADRKCFIIGIGGGITLDIAGFVSSTYMRGLSFGFIPTTLLAMVDASIGGKNGVNFEGFKNYIGCFTHPEFIIISSNFLKTLPEAEFLNGIAEVIKYGAIYNPEILTFLIEREKEIKDRKKETVDFIIQNSVKAKVSIVKDDFKESGLRKVLNFGHTLGHALERLKVVSHGQGVAAGMVFAAFLSKQKGYLKEEEFEKIRHTISLYRLPAFIPDASIEELIRGISGDKKKAGDSIDFILLKSLGRPVIEPISLVEIEHALQNLYKHYS